MLTTNFNVGREDTAEGQIIDAVAAGLTGEAEADMKFEAPAVTVENPLDAKGGPFHLAARNAEQAFNALRRGEPTGCRPTAKVASVILRAASLRRAAAIGNIE